jgi:D-aspartate ligase
MRASGAVVIGGDYRGLGVVRSLGRRGIPVWVLTNDHRVATASRYARFDGDWPQHPAQQIRYLLKLCDLQGLDRWALFPTDDEATAVLAQHHAVLSKRFLMTTPPWDVLRWSYDKRLMHRLASETGVAQPRTFMPKNRHEVVRLECGFPAILKPAYKPDLNRFTRAKAWRVENVQMLMSSYDEASELVDPAIIMVQEFIPGGGENQVSYAALCADGKPLASMTVRRTRQYPTDFGRASTYVEAVTVPEIVEPSERLLHQLKLTGLVEVEFKRDSTDGIYKLLDINARVWGWHTLGWQAGIDFPYLMWRLAHGEPLPEIRTRAGARWMRVLMDLPAAAGEILSGRLSIKEYARSLGEPMEFAIFAQDDLLPALLDLPYLALLAWKRLNVTNTSARIQHQIVEPGSTRRA